MNWNVGIEQLLPSIDARWDGTWDFDILIYFIYWLIKKFWTLSGFCLQFFIFKMTKNCKR